MDIDEIRAMMTKFRKKCISETNANLGKSMKNAAIYFS